MTFEGVRPSDVIVTLTRGLETIVSGIDAPVVRAHRWHAHFNQNGEPYARNRRAGLLQRFIVRPPLAWLVADHINGNPLDNRRFNLRVCSPSENARNAIGKGRSGLKGVSWNGKRWRARIMAPNGVERFLGAYNCPSEAARAYDAAALEYHGPFAWLNFPVEIDKEGELPLDVPF